MTVLQDVDLHLEQGSNLSFAVEFRKIVERLGLNYAQSLRLMNSLPVQ
ncbi:hypothetical protein [Pseudomonas chlororaphis]|nr:hypothetical protein [Pseudomonas chlororaphis]AZD28870.1 hypothetical protein C4K23_2121 [Pseudomonas chlororaphis]ETD37975.1 hypothetical protein U724_18575 [Pseudomonas chlororaphis subsp. aurantiaca PB-St2]